MSTPTETPTEKLTRSRARMVSALAATQKSNQDNAKSDNGLLTSILAMYLAQHPLPATGNAVTHTLEKVVAPWVRTHPLQAVLGAALVGAVLIWSRPWNLLSQSAPLAWLLPQLLSKWMAKGEMQQHQATDKR